MSIETLFPINFSHSMLSDIWTCEFSWYNKHVRRFTGMYRSGDLIAGGHLASACEITRKAFFNEGVDEETAIELGYEHILSAEDTTDALKTNERVAFAFKQYFKRFKMDSSLVPCQLADGTHAIEYKFLFDTGIKHPELDQNICFTGKLDGLYRRIAQNHFVSNHVVDEKTTKSVRRITGTKLIDIQAEEEEYLTSGQLIAYHWAARKLGVKTESSLIRRIPILTNWEAAYELEIPVNQFMIDSWEYATFAKIKELVSKYRWLQEHTDKDPREAFYPVYNSGCTSYRKLCAFSDGCTSKHGDAVLTSKYRQIIFNEGKELSLKEFKQLRGL